MTRFGRRRSLLLVPESKNNGKRDVTKAVVFDGLVAV